MLEQVQGGVPVMVAEFRAFPWEPPRITRIIALAVKFDGLLREGILQD